MRTLSPIAVDGRHDAAIVHPQLANSASVPIEPHPSIIATDALAGQPAQSIELPVTISGRIAEPGGKQSFRFQAAAGKTLLFRVESRQLGFPLDPVLELFDSAGKSLSRVDDVGNNLDAELSFAVPADGEYLLTISDLHRQGGPRHVYRLRAAPATPDFALSMAAESFASAPETDLEIPVTIDRQHGFNLPIVVRVSGLPDGPTAEAVTSPAEGDLSKVVKLVVKTGKQPFSGVIQVIGETDGPERVERRALAPIAERTAKTDQPWLTVTAP
jgi:hypothetical protein